MKKLLVITGVLLVAVAILAACGGQAAPTEAPQAPVVEQPTDVPLTAAPEPTSEPEPTDVPLTAAPEPTSEPEPTEEPVPAFVLPMPQNPREVLVQAVHDGSQVALRFTWVSTKDFGGQYHDFVRFGEGKWDRLPSAVRINEDRVSFMIDNPAQPIPAFATMGCYVACHSDLNSMPEQPKNAEGAAIDTRHYVLAPEGGETGTYALDMWHWRGGRSGPAGYAEDTWVAYGEYGTGAQGRQRDKASGPTNWVRSGGDRMIEDQNWGGDLLFWNDTMLPRFVFNPAKSGFNNYFLAGSSGKAFTDVDALLNGIEDSTYGSNLIVYQDLSFDPVDKVNSIDVLYLLVTAGAVEAPEYNNDWADYWAAQTGVSEAADAEAMLNDIVAAMEEGVMVTHSVNFIYASSQHEIPATREFDYATKTWTVTMVRNLTTDTAGVDDVDLSALANGTLFPFAFAMHDQTKGGIAHYISFPYTLGIGEDADVVVAQVASVSGADWASIPGLSTAIFTPLKEFAFQQLTDPSAHPGGAVYATIVANSMNCQSCHSVDPANGIILKTP